MNFDSPSKIMQSIFTHPSLSSKKENATNILTDSPDSPSFLPKHLANRPDKKISRQPPVLSTKNLNSVIELNSKGKNSYDSPTTTLAADLSQNFRIRDLKDPLIPTPKRSLKLEALTESGLTNKLLDSISSSKDGLTEDEDDFFQSPLVNKTLESKKPLVLKDSSRATSISSLNSIMSTSSMSSIDSETDKFTFSLPNKPSLRRAQTLFSKHSGPSSFSNSIFKSASTFRGSDSLLPGFNDEDDEDSNEDSNNEGEEEHPLDKLCFASPVQANKQKQNKFAQDDLSNKMKREIGSPIQKKDLRAKVRRTHSMFHSKKDISDTTQMFGNLMGSPHSPNFFNEHGDSTSLSNSILHKSKINTFKVSNDQLPRIDSTEFCKILDGHFKEFFDEIIIADCRFEYEYNGGHIQGAINISSQDDLAKNFLIGNKNPTSPSTMTGSFGKKASHPLVIFHCEYSAYRGPSMALHLRSCDRNLNQDRYPHLDFPDILVLEGGYKNFFEKHASRCFPQEYVKMENENHKEHNERGMKKFRKDFKRASSYNSLAFSSAFQQSRTHTRTLSSRALQFNSASTLSTMTDTTATTTTTNSISLARTKSLFESSFSKPSIKFPKLPLSSDFINDDEETEGMLPSVNLSFKFPLNPDEIPSQSPDMFAKLMNEEEEGKESEGEQEEEEEAEEELIMKRKVLGRSKTMKY
ncbi:hypothetical protein WICPIJ_008268 [Wickerhamomyces pijperi]|uniref:M-phase inducer phosphatase n=1 Tax=Wickerhamomyces pijperi TaxID=599730 RepID=A0A9P8TIW6_WICPI|nr:hypothetical protein WICPIJ_008268 [Wickerhamomyces pijperi]